MEEVFLLKRLVHNQGTYYGNADLERQLSMSASVEMKRGRVEGEALFVGDLDFFEKAHQPYKIVLEAVSNPRSSASNTQARCIPLCYHFF